MTALCADQKEWRGDEQVGLSTLHSAGGLEFDHVVVLAPAAEQMPHGPEEDDTQLNNHRRLVAMAIGRARRTAALSYKPGEESSSSTSWTPIPTSGSTFDDRRRDRGAPRHHLERGLAGNVGDPSRIPSH